ncbi:MAG: O-antigen ligase family protein [Anaerolineae bacterium]|nr:O-antigen ligase family protein [Anaerolineae bacterium]
MTKRLHLRRLKVEPWEVLRLALALVALGVGLLIVRAPLLEAFILLLIAGVAIGSLLEPLVGVSAALLCGPLAAWLAAEVPQVPVQLGRELFLVAVAAWLLRKLARRDVYIPWSPLLWPLLAFMGVTLLSLWQPADLWMGFMEWAKWGQLLLMFLLVYDRIQGRESPTQATSKRRIAALVVVITGGALFQAAMGIWQYGLRGYGPENFALGEGLYRAYGTFEQPNPFGGFLGLVGALLAGLLLAVALDVWQKKRLPPAWVWLMGVAWLVVAGGVYLSWSRGAWLGFGAALLVMGVVLPRRGLWGIVLLALLVGGGIGLYHTGRLPAPVASRLTGFLAYTRFEDVRGAAINNTNYAVLERMAHWQAALEMWRANFWSGVGFGCYEAAYPEYHLLNWPFALGHAHNYYLNLLAETGILGLGAYLLFTGTLFARLWQATRRLTGWQRGLALGLIGAGTQFGVHDLVDNLLVNNVHLYVGALLALAAWVVGRSSTISH